MSHFSVLVIGDNVEEQLEPYWELDYGTLEEIKNDSRSSFIDKTDELKKEYETKGIKKWYPDHTSFDIDDIYDSDILKFKKEKVMEFYCVVTALNNYNNIKCGNKFGFYYDRNSGDTKIIYGKIIDIEVLNLDQKLKLLSKNKIKELYDKYKSFEKITQVLNNQIKYKIKVELIDKPEIILHKEKYKNFDEFIKDYYDGDNYEMYNGKYGFFDNPNAKWDWYQIGGRYCNLLKLKSNKKLKLIGKMEGFEKAEIEKLVYFYQENRDKFEKIVVKYEGKTEKIRKIVMDIIDSKNDYNELFVDSAKKGDIDWDYMNDNKNTDHGMFWDIYVDGVEIKTEEQQKCYDKYKDFLLYKKDYYIDKYKNKENYIKIMNSFQTFAVLDNGKWIGKGDMGWFGYSSESNDESFNWDINYYDNFIKNLGDNIKLTIVDCHI